MFKKLILLIALMLVCSTAYCAVTKTATGGITITSGIYSLSTLTTEVADANYLSYDAPTNTYTLNASDTYTTPNITINNGTGLVETGDGWTLVWNDPANNVTGLFCNTMGTLTLTGNNVAINASTTADGNYFTLRGQVYIGGTPTNYMDLQHLDRSAIESFRPLNNKVEVCNLTYSGGMDTATYPFYINPQTYCGEFDIHDIYIDATGINYSFYLYAGLYGLDQKFRNITVDGGLYAILGTGITAKFEGCTFKNIAAPVFNAYSAGQTIGKNTFNRIDTYNTYQNYSTDYPMIVLDTCYFDSNDSNVYQIQHASGATALYKNCTFNASAGTWAYGNYDVEILIYNNTYTGGVSSTPYLTYGSSVYDAYPVDVQATDEFGNPLDGAGLFVTGFADSDPTTALFKISMISDSDGHFKTFCGDVPYFPYYETGDLGNTRSITDYRICIGKRGYRPDVYRFTLDGDKTIVRKMVDEDTPEGNNFYDSILIDSIIQ